MIADLKPYAEYKDSGLPWLGQVPGHWEVQRLKNWVTINRHTLGEDTPADYEFDYLDIGAVTTGRLAKHPVRLRFADAPSRARRVLQSGDTIVSTVRTYLKAVLTVNECSQPLVASTGFAVLSPRADTTPRCLGYVAQSDAFTNQVTAESVGIAYPAISETRLGNIAVTLPPPDEQAAIVRFLDWANGRLERAIRAKRKVIALLGEQKQAIIHRAVTGKDEVRMMKDENGNSSFILQPSSLPRKPSGIPWLGDIPQHWEVRRMKSLSLVKRGASPRPIADMRYFDESGEYAWVRIKDVTASNRYLETTTERLSELGKSRSVPLEPGAIFLSIAGSVGKPIISKIKCCIHDGFVYFPQFRGNAEFLLYVFSSGRVYDGLGKLGTQLNLNTETVGSIRVPLPEVAEQEHIVAFLNRELSTFEVAISRLNREIELLREYRTRLVADVVTGKLDVRAAAARLPDEAPLDSIEDDTDLSDEPDNADDEASP
ncbi:MAG: restriction endonuclease subunit S [Gammaproteobacteria bacterium]|nr:restriction endonuclease subunit S [Gammaproteobacteria bacterium]